jgi:uncharacterized membrane protein
MIGVLLIVAAVVLLSGPVAFVLVLDQRRTIRRLQQELTGRGELGAARAWSPATPVATGPAPATPVATGPAPGIPVAASRNPEAAPVAAAQAPGSPPFSIPTLGGRDLERWIGAQWLTWLGILAIFVGTAFFLAIDLTGPMAGVGQVLVGLLVGALFLGSGSVLARRQRILAQGLLGGGVALLFLSAYAAYGFHHLVAASVAYVFLFGVAGVGAAVALRENAASIAVLTLIGAYLTPPLLDQGRVGSDALLPYLVAVGGGAVAVAVRRSWPGIPYLSALGTVVLILEAWRELGEPVPLVAVGIPVTLLWLLYSLFPLRVTGTAPFRGAARTGVIVIAAIAFAGFVHAWVGDHAPELRGVALALLAILYVVGGRLTRDRASAMAAIYYHYSGLALAMVAIPVALDAHWVTTAWALMGAVLAEGAIRGRSREHAWAALLVLAGAAARTLSVDTVATLERASRQTEAGPGAEAVAGFITAAALGFAGWRLRRGGVVSLRVGDLLAVVAPSLLLWTLTAETWAWFDSRARLAGQGSDPTRAALLTTSWIWAVYAALLIAAGFVVRYRPLRLLGVAVVALLIAKIFFLDLRELDRGYRIASFAGVGVLLLAMSLLYQRERR